MIRSNRMHVRLYDWVKLLLASIVMMGVATTGVALATASAASATATPVIASVNANYSLTGTGLPKAFTGTTPANQTDASLSAAVTNPSTATTLSFTSISDTYNFSPVGDLDVYAACSDTATGVQSPSYVFSYTANPFTVSGTSLASGGTGVTGAKLLYTNPACSSTATIASGSEVYQTGSPEASYAIANVTSGLSSVNTASLAVTTAPPAADGFAWVDPVSGQIYMTPEPTASGNFSLTYAYCVPGVTLTSDPSGLSDGNCATATVTYIAAQHCELVGENVSVSISSSDIYQSICSSTVAPATVSPGQTFTYDTIPGTSVIPVEESTSIGNATIQYADNFVSIVPLPNGVTYVPGSATAVGGDPTSRGHATVEYCTAPRTGCDATLSGNYKTTYPYIELELNSSIHIAGGSMLTLPYVQAQFTAAGAPGTEIGTALTEFRLSTQVDIPIIGSNTAAFDGYPTSCGSPPENSDSGPCSSSTTPPYAAPTIYPFTEIVPGVTGVTTAAGGAVGSDTGGATVQISGSGFTGATAVNFGSTPATSYTVNSDSSITATAPAEADGTVDVTVTTNGATSPTSAADQFSFIPPSVPDAPSGIQVTPGDGNPTDGFASVSWAPTYGEGFAVTGYTVTAADNTNPSNPNQTCTSTDPTDSCSVSGLTDGDSYTFSVVATNTIGNSNPGTTTVTEGATTAPTAVSATAGQESATVSFAPPATSGDGSTVSGYTVTATDTTTPGNGGQTASGSSSPITVSGLTDGDSYRFTVTATNGSGTSAASSASSSVTPIGVPGAPTAVSGTSNANAQSVVSFTAPAATHGSAITSYKVTATDTTNGANGGQTCTYTIPTPPPDTNTYSCTVTGLTNGDSYTFTATATNGVGTGPASVASAPVVPATTPGAPTGVTAAPNPAGGVVVSWLAPVSNGGSPITSYTAKASSGSFTCTATAPATTCTITGTTIGTSYTYSVTATNGVGASAASAASASVKTTSVPAAPTAVVGTGSPEQVSVAFTGDTTTATEGGLTITGYTVTATDVTNPANGGQTATGTASPIVVTGLTDLDEYTFTVHATNSVGNSPESAASGQVAPGGVPSAPLNATAVNVSPGGNAQVSWNPPANPGGVITQYTVTSSTGSKTCTYTGPFGAGETDTCTVTGLTIGTSYTYTVKATNQSGTSPASAASNAVVSSTLPSAPTSPSASTGNGTAAVAFTGDTTTATEGGIAISGYTVTATDVTNPANGGQTASGTASPVTVTGLTNGDSYTFTVHATNANGNSTESVATAAVNPGRPSAPTAVVSGADPSSQTTLDISWAASTSPDGTSPITGYTVTSSPGAFTCTTTGATTCNVTGLTAKTAYTFTVTATNQYGTSPASAASTAQDAGYPGIPTGVTVAQVSPIGANSSTASIVVSWTVPNNGGSALTTETATSSSGSKTCTDTTHLTAGQTATCTMTGLTTGTSYTVSVKGTNANGTGSASAASAAIVPMTLPAAPTALKAATGNGQETVSFTGDTTASTEGGSAIIGYTVTSSPGAFTCTGTTTSCTVTGLTNGTPYTFTATATTAVGTSVASAASTALNAGVPTPPTGVVAGADATSSTTMDVSWTAATSPDGTSPITGYTVTSSPGSLTCTTTGATSCNVTGLTAKTAYTFTVTATNQYGTGLASAASTSQNAGYPGIPTGASAVLVQNVPNGAAAGQVTVTWTVPNNGGSALTSQTATSSSGSKTCTDNTDITAGTTAHCTVTGLTDGTAYTFTVKDVNANGTGTASAASNSVTAETLPLAPTAPSGTPGLQSVTVAFTAPSTTNSGAISSYTVTATDTTNAGNGGQTASGSASPITVTGLTVGDTYTFTVTATGVDGTGPASVASAGVIPSNVPDAPAAPSATPGDQLAVVSWTAPFAEYSPITGYTVTDGVGDGCTTTGATTCTVTGLTDGTAYTFTVTATNADGTGSASGASAPVTPLHTAITSAASTTFVNGSAGSFTVVASGTPAITYAETGALPNGVSLDPSTGILSGTPSVTPDAYGAYQFTVSATSALSGTDTQSFTLTVDAAPAVTSDASTTFTVGSAGSFTVAATGYPQPTFSESGALPNGVTLDSVSGQLSGTPAAGTGGTYLVTLTASNGVAPDASQSFTLTVDQAPAITSGASTTLTVGTAGSFTVTATGFPAPTYSETGNLPGGVTLDPNSGALSGTPSASTGGVYHVSISASNGVGAAATQSFTLTVDQAPAITSAATGTVTQGINQSVTVTASGYPAPTFSETGTLPAGYTLSPGGVLSGDTYQTGTFAFTLKASNGIGSTATQSYTLTVLGAAPQITSSATASFTVGQAGSFTVTTTGAPTPAITKKSALPAGLVLTDNNDGTATISGTPNAGTGKLYTVMLQAKSSSGTVKQSLALSVFQAPAFTSSSPKSKSGKVGKAFSVTLQATGYPAPTFSATTPPGVTLTNTGGGKATLSGYFLVGTQTFTITASNGHTPDATETFTLSGN